MSTFVAVGNATQPFDRLLHAISEIANQLPQPVFVQFGAASLRGRQGWSGAAYMDMAAFEERVRNAELLILHAGAGSVIHAIRAGKTPVIVPRRASFGEHVDDHQMEFARELEKTGKVVVLHEGRSLSAAVLLALQRQKAQHSTPRREAVIVAMIRQALRSAEAVGGAN